MSTAVITEAKPLRIAHVVFAVTMIGLGVIGLVEHGFAPIWSVVPKAFPGRQVLAYVCAFVSLGSGIGMLWRRTASVAAGLLTVFLLAWIAVFRLPLLVRAPTSSGVWWVCGETAMMLATALILYGERYSRIARCLYGFGLIPLGVAHFTYFDRTVGMVPSWLPWHVGWAIFTGCAFIAAGVAIIVGVYARLAAILSAWEMGLFTLLVWVPVMVAGHPSASDRTESIGSWVLTAAAWVIADSFRGQNTMSASLSPK